MALKKVTLYSKPSCVQCTATERWLNSNGYKDEFEHADAIENIESIKGLAGFQQAPVIKVVDSATSEVTFWSGHNPILLEKHLKVA